MSKPKIGQRFRHYSLGPATVIASDDCEVLKKHPDQSQKWRDSFTWFKFDDGGINGWSTMVSFVPILTLEDKVEAARQALADAEAELEASRTPKAGDRWVNGEFTATVKFVDENFVFYTYTTVRSNNPVPAGRRLKSFLRDYTKQICGC